MPIGSPLTNSVAAVGASGTGYATTTNALLTELKTAVEGTVPFSALSGSTLDLNNIPITDAQYVAFYDQGATPSAAIPGRIVYANGEMWAVNSTGAIQITSGTGLNAAAIGGIGGDYGSPNPALVSFVDAADRYDFYHDRTTFKWAYLRSRGIDIAGAEISTNYCQLRYAGSSVLTLTLPSSVAAAAERSVVQVDSAGQMSTNSSGTPLIGKLYISGDIDISGNLIRGSRYIEYAPQRGVCHVTAGALNINSPLVIASGGSTTVKFGLPALPRGATISFINVKGYKSTAGVMTFQLSTVVTGASAVETETNIGSAGTSSTSGVYTATQSYTQVVSQYDSYRLTMTLPANTDSCWCVEIGLGGNL